MLRRKSNGCSDRGRKIRKQGKAVPTRGRLKSDLKERKETRGDKKEENPSKGKNKG